MAQQFGSTSFIPKKPQGPPAKRRGGSGMSIFFLGGLIIFLLAVSAAVGAFLFMRITQSNIEQKTGQLERAKAAFEPALIEELSRLDRRIKSAEEILNTHRALSEFFAFLEGSTLQNVQFDNFSFTTTPDGRLGISMNGRALSFSSVALQADIFGKDPFIQSSLFTNLDLDDVGNVTFDFSAAIDPTLLSYRKSTNTSLIKNKEVGIRN